MASEGTEQTFWPRLMSYTVVKTLRHAAKEMILIGPVLKKTEQVCGAVSSVISKTVPGQVSYLDSLACRTLDFVESKPKFSFGKDKNVEKFVACCSDTLSSMTRAYLDTKTGRIGMGGIIYLIEKSEQRLDSLIQYYQVIPGVGGTHSNDYENTPVLALSKSMEGSSMLWNIRKCLSIKSTEMLVKTLQSFKNRMDNIAANNIEPSAHSSTENNDTAQRNIDIGPTGAQTVQKRSHLNGVADADEIVVSAIVHQPNLSDDVAGQDADYESSEQGSTPPREHERLQNGDSGSDENNDLPAQPDANGNSPAIQPDANGDSPATGMEKKAINQTYVLSPSKLTPLGSGDITLRISTDSLQ